MATEMTETEAQPDETEQAKHIVKIGKPPKKDKSKLCARHILNINVLVKNGDVQS